MEWGRLIVIKFMVKPSIKVWFNIKGLPNSLLERSPGFKKILKNKQFKGLVATGGPVRRRRKLVPTELEKFRKASFLRREDNKNPGSFETFGVGIRIVFCLFYFVSFKINAVGIPNPDVIHTFFRVFKVQHLN